MGRRRRRRRRRRMAARRWAGSGPGRLQRRVSRQRLSLVSPLRPTPQGSRQPRRSTEPSLFYDKYAISQIVPVTRYSFVRFRSFRVFTLVLRDAHFEIVPCFPPAVKFTSRRDAPRAACRRTSCRRPALTVGSATSARSAAAAVSASTVGSAPGARSAAAAAAASTVGSAAGARIAAAAASASTGGGAAAARTAAAAASASMDGGVASARSAAVPASANTGGGATSARSAAAAVKNLSFSRRRWSKVTRTQSPMSGSPLCHQVSESAEERDLSGPCIGYIATVLS